MPLQDGLPQQMLVQVLQRVCIRDRLNCALVCSAWREAAAQATSQITFTNKASYQRKSDSLTVWLLTHGHAAAVESITVVGEGTVTYAHPLLLPIEQLPDLRHLAVSKFSVAAVPNSEAAAAVAAAAAAAATAAAAAPAAATAGSSARFMASTWENHHAYGVPTLPLGLSALTHLSLDYCFMQLAALSAFTHLQRLELHDSKCGYNPGPPMGYDARTNAAALQQALPHLQQLTRLELGCRFTPDPVVAALKHLTRLQHLELGSSICSEAALGTDGALPVSLTHLHFEGILGTNDRTLSPDTTPSITQLTALRSLHIGSVASLDAALLAPLTALQDVYVLNCHTPPAGLSVLSALTQLQRLNLVSRAPPHAPAGTAADVAALTASTGLTYLGIGDGLVRPHQHIHMLPAGRSLPGLQVLCATRGLLSDVATVDRLVRCCPALQRLWLTRADPDEPGAGFAEDIASGFERHSWASLGDLTNLTSLHMNLEGMQAPDVDWMWLGYIRSLRKLDVLQIGWGQIQGILELTGCRGLTALQLLFRSAAGFLEPTQVELKNQAPEGLPPDVWCQLPYAILTAAKRRLASTNPLEALEPQVEEAIRSVIDRATNFLWSFAELHRTQQQELRQQLIGVQAELSQQREQWQAEVAGLKGAMAAMAAQLQAMQLQLGR